MLRIIYVLGLALSAACCLAQETPLDGDSLKKELQLHPAQDSFRVLRLTQMVLSISLAMPDSAMAYAREAMQISKKINWRKGIALSHRLIGAQHYVKADFLNALDQFQQALVADSGRSKLFEASIANNIANIYLDLKQHQKALDYYKRTLEVARQVKSREIEVMALGNIGHIYVELEDLPSAESYYQQCLGILEKTNNLRFKAIILIGLGVVSKKKHDYETALSYINQSIKISEQLNDQSNIASAYTNLSEIYLVQGELSKAESYANQALKLAKELGILNYQSDAVEALSKIYEKQRNIEKALITYKLYIVLRDSVMNEEKRSEITRKEMQYKLDKQQALTTAQQDKQRVIAEAAINRQRIIRNSILGGAVVLILAVFISFASYKKRRDAQVQQKEAEFKAEITDTEMKALRAQMNPHFIYNSLDSIINYLSNHDIRAAKYYLRKFAGLMRLILNHSERKEIMLSEDLQALESYMQLESMRLNNRLSFEIKVDNEIDPENTLIPPLLLQPFVENSIKHGISPLKGGGKILIHISRQGEMIHCIVEDNGIGRTKSPLIYQSDNQQGNRSFGMKITTARINIINRLKKTSAAVEISDLDQGLRVEVKLPFESAY